MELTKFWLDRGSRNKSLSFQGFLKLLIPRESFKTSGGEQRMTPHLAGQGGTEEKLQW